MSPLVRRGRRLSVASVIALGLLAAGCGSLGALLLRDRPGLETEFFAGSASWQGEPVWTETSLPQLLAVSPLQQVLAAWRGEGVWSETVSPGLPGAGPLRGVLASLEIFSLRWRGWLVIDRSGSYRFELASDETGYLKLADETLVDLSGLFGEPRDSGERWLTAGRYPLEIGFVQTRGEARLEALWSPPDEAPRPLDPKALFDRRPGSARRWSRLAIGGLATKGRLTLAVFCLVAGLTLGAVALRGATSARGAPLEPAPRRRRSAHRIAALLALALLAGMLFTVVLDASGSPRGHEDIRWLDLAVHGSAAAEQPSNPAHLLLVRAFATLAGDDAFGAARACSASLFTLTALALGAGATLNGSRRVSGSLVATFFVFAGQPMLFSAAGAVWPEVSAMAWVTAGIAVCLTGLADRGRGIWKPAVALGALTLLAMRSHPSGAILLWPGLLLFFKGARVSAGTAAAGLGAWVSGLLAASLGIRGALALADERLPELGEVLSPGSPATVGWVEALWAAPAGSPATGAGLRALALLVVAAAMAATFRGMSLERRLLHLTPVLFVLALLARQAAGGTPPIPTDLLPILPAACLLGGALFSYAGLDELSLDELVQARFLLPAVTLATLVAVVDPYLSGRLTAAELLPGLDPLAAGDAMRRTVAPGVGLALALAAIFCLRWRRMRLPILLSAALLAFGPAAAVTGRSLAAHRPAQISEVLLYPWRQFEEEIRVSGRTRIHLSPELFDETPWFGPPTAAQAIARLYFDQPDLELKVNRSLRGRNRADYALLRPEQARIWRQRSPETVRYTTEDEAGRLALVRRKPPRQRPAAGDRAGAPAQDRKRQPPDEKAGP